MFSLHWTFLVNWRRCWTKPAAAVQGFNIEYILVRSIKVSCWHYLEIALIMAFIGNQKSHCIAAKILYNLKRLMLNLNYAFSEQMVAEESNLWKVTAWKDVLNLFVQRKKRGQLRLVQCRRLNNIKETVCLLFEVVWKQERSIICGNSLARKDGKESNMYENPIECWNYGREFSLNYQCYNEQLWFQFSPLKSGLA